MDEEVPPTGPYTALLSQVTTATSSQYTSVIRQIIEEEDLNWAYEGVDVDTVQDVSLENDEEESLLLGEIDGITQDTANDVATETRASSDKRVMHEPLSEFFSDIGVDNEMCTQLGGHENIGNYNFLSHDLAIGLRFKDKESLVQACKRYSIKCNQQYKVEKSNDDIYILWCIMRETQGCKWRVRAIKSKKHKMWEITKYDSPHTCLYSHDNQDHRQLDSSFIARHISNLVRASHSMSISLVIAQIFKDFEHTISYRKAWKAKQKAIAMIFGDWDNSYSLLPKFLLAVLYYNHGSVAKYQFTNTSNQGEAILNRVFWAFEPSIKGFAHCRPVVSVDGTHLYGKYKGKLLIATGCDAGNKLYPLAFAIVEEESTDSWLWFLQRLRYFVIGDRQNVCLISDRHAGIISAVKTEGSGWEKPYAHHRFCIRHVEANFNQKFKDPFVRALYNKAAKTRQVRKFVRFMNEMRTLDERAYNYLRGIDVEKWTLAYDGGVRYGLETTNLSEVLNGVVKGARNLPITALAQMTFYKLVEYFCKRRVTAQKLFDESVRFSEKVKERLEHNQSRSRGHRLIKFDAANGLAEVITRQNNVQVVNIKEQVCTCSKWTLYKVPCSHAIATCEERSFDWLQYVDHFYTVEAMLASYTPQFQPLEHEDYWPTPSEPTFIPDDRLLRAKGRPKSTRYKNIMDQSEIAAAKRCSKCKEHGHNRRKCSNS